MKCEVEFLDVGEGSRPGDAIVIRYGDEYSYELMIVDGGNAETGEKIVSHVQRQFGNVPISHVVLTHPDIDHASGLRTVVEQMDVRNLWVNPPWLFASIGRELFNDPRWTEDGISREVASNYDIVSQILSTAVSRGIPWNLPMQGAVVGPFTVLSPSAYALKHLVPQFDKTPSPDQEAITAAGFWIGKESMLSRILASVQATAASWVPELWGVEGLRDGGVTSASNESSVILYGNFDSQGSVLLTGDAGIRALTWAADYLDAVGVPLRQFGFVQIPHHGSRRNVGPTILNRLIGPPVPEGLNTGLSAYVSAPRDDATHPRKIVLNAFTRRGAQVYATQGQAIVNNGGFRTRPGYGPIAPVPFAPVVEGYA